MADEPDNEAAPGGSRTQDDEATWGITNHERQQAGLSIARYPIVRELGRGGQGVVYLAEDRTLGRPVALKVLSHAMALSTEARLRFRREAETASRLDHPGICTIYEFGDESGVPYIAMQFVEGEGFDRVIRQTRDSLHGPPARLDPDARSASTATRGTAVARSDLFAVVEFVESVARAVHHAHESGLVHRDIKPSNIMVAADGKPVVLDFGLARDESTEGPALTGSGDVLGTPAYMAPEQVEGSVSVDRRTDVHALGAVLFECLTLRRPFTAPTLAALYKTIVRDNAPLPSSINRAIPADLDTVIAVSLEKDVGHRYQTAEAFADDLRAVIEHRPISAREVPKLTRVARWSRRHPAAAALVGALILGIPALVGLSTYILVRQPLVEQAELQADRVRAEQAIERGFMESESARKNRAIAAFSEAVVGGRLLPTAVAGIAVLHAQRRETESALAVLDAHDDVVGGAPGLQFLRNYLIERSKGHGINDAMSIVDMTMDRAVDAFLLGMRERTLAASGDASRWSTALGFFEQAALRSAPRAIYFFRAVEAAGEAGERARLEAFAGAILAQWPDKPASYYWSARAFARMGDLARASDILKRGLRKAADDPTLHCALGDVAFKGGDRVAAIRHLERAVSLDADYAEPYLTLGHVLTSQDKFEDAIQNFKAATRINPFQDDAFHSMAVAYQENSDLEGARKAALQAVSIDPYYAPHRILLVDILVMLGDFKAVLAQGRLFVRHNPGQIEELAQRATAFRLFGLLSMAFMDLDSAEPGRISNDPSLRVLASNAAAIAAAGAGRDRSALSRAHRDDLRRQCLRWLRAELTSLDEALKNESKTADSVRRSLLRLEQHRGFRSLRGDRLDGLPVPDRAAWTKYWEDVAEMIVALDQ